MSIPLAQAPTVTLDNLDWFEQDGIDPDAVIMNPEKARERGPTSTVTFPTGNLAPAGLVIKARPGATLS